MIITLLVLLYLAWQTYRGYQIGFTRRIINLVLSAIIFIIAILVQNSLGNWLYQQFATQASTHSGSMDLMIYRFAAFFLLMFVLKQFVKIFKMWLPVQKARTTFPSVLDAVLGAAVSFIAAYFFAYVVLSMANALQNQWFMQQTIDSSFLRFIIYDTPGFSNDFFNNIFGISRTIA